jgi:hypothetical protein
VIVTATASVMLTSTRDPVPRAAAKVRRFGGTTARRVRPSGVRKVASRGRVAAGPGAFRGPAGQDRGVDLAGVGRVGHAGGDRLVEVDLDLVARLDLGEVAHLRPGGDGEDGAVGVVAQHDLAGALVDRLDRRRGGHQRLLHALAAGSHALGAARDRQRGQKAEHLCPEHLGVPHRCPGPERPRRS